MRKQLICLGLAGILSTAIHAQKHEVSLNASYGFSKLRYKSFDRFAESYNTLQAASIVSPLKRFSDAKTFDITLNFKYFHVGFSRTTAFTEVQLINNESRSFSFGRRAFTLGGDLSTKNRGVSNKLWMTFCADLSLGIQDITTSYNYLPGVSYSGSNYKNLNGQFDQDLILFQFDASLNYKIKNIGFFIKGSLCLPDLLNNDMRNRTNANNFANLNILPTDYGKYNEDPTAYEFSAIDDKSMVVGAKNLLSTITFGVAFHFVNIEKIKEKEYFKIKL